MTKCLDGEKPGTGQARSSRSTEAYKAEPQPAAGRANDTTDAAVSAELATSQPKRDQGLSPPLLSAMVTLRAIHRGRGRNTGLNNTDSH